MTTCLICHGLKTIKLPVMHPVTYSPSPATLSMTMDRDTSRTYPCPECVTGAADERLHIAGASVKARTSDLEHPDRRQIINHDAAHELAGYFLRHNLITFTERETGAFDTTEVIARMAVVSPDRITSIEKRVKDATQPAIQAVMYRAIESIDIWGRDLDLDMTTIAKRDAIRFIREAVREQIT